MYLVKEQQFRLKDFVLDTPEIRLPEKGLVVLTGQNGSGKTLFLNYLIGLINRKKLLQKPEIDIGDYDDIGVFFNQNSLLQHLSVQEYFTLLITLFGNKSADSSYAQNLLTQLQLEPKDINRKIKKFSLGNQKKIGLSGSIIHNPKVVIWDEPFANLDDSSQELLVDSIYNLKSEKLVIIGTPNVLSLAADVSFLLNSGVMTVQKT